MKFLIGSNALIRAGNIRLKETREMLARHLPAIEQALSHCTLVEIDQKSISIIAQ